MKKNQYVIGIIAGIIKGSIVMLFCRDLKTALLFGMISAGISAWICSLDWSKAREFGERVACKLNISASFLPTRMAKVAKKILDGFVRILRIIIFIPKMLKDCLIMRKVAFGMVLFVVIGAADIYKLINCSKEIYLFFVLALCLLVFANMLYIVLFFVLCYNYDASFAKGAPDDTTRSNFSNFRESFLFGWMEEVLMDKNGVLKSYVRMFYIRTINALKILAYPFVFAIWGFYVLANNKTGISALSAMILVAMHGLASYFYGGIQLNNINYWLSLFLVIMAGAWIGRMIWNAKEFVYLKPMPTIVFRRQVEPS